MPLSALFILDINGTVLIFRDYRGDVRLDFIANFLPTLNKAEDCGTPVLQCGSKSFAFIKVNDLFIVSLIKGNANIGLIFMFMHKFINIMTEYFNKIESESIKDNFVIIYELLDEIIDFGYPQTTDPAILQTYITQESYKLNHIQLLPSVVTNVVSWRPHGIHYRRNEVFIDVIESVNMTMTSKGTILKHEVAGCVKMKVNLSGMPQLRLGLSDNTFAAIHKRNSTHFEGVNFHQCVQLSRLHDKNICFVPPDGEFELMSYRLNAELKPLILVRIVTTKISFSRIEYQLYASSQFRKSSTANNVEIILPIDPDADSPIIRTTMGSAYFDPAKMSVIWKIKFFPGCMEYYLQAKFKLCSIECEEKEIKVPLQVKFTIPYFTISGLQVKFIKVIEKSNYKALTWVRYSTTNGEYLISFN